MLLLHLDCLCRGVLLWVHLQVVRLGEELRLLQLQDLVDLFGISAVDLRLLFVWVVGHHLVEQECSIDLGEEFEDSVSIFGLPQ